ncbi:MAG TPA: aminodeoxychorismate/anthranilate synthase component II [Polyangiaceae bacterium]|nr:aminodeoxychorismate/anthranilate synthase component II [Polyangiaceae bacterium]
MPKRVTVIDNYDSFTYNLVQYLQTLKVECVVYLNDRVEVVELENQPPDGILLSPGPGTPDDAGVTLEVIRRLSGKVPMLGVCLGHQSIAQAMGARIVRAERLMHGKTSPIEHDGSGIFSGIPSPFTATRYHSLLVDPATVPPELEVTARTRDGEIMAIRHQSFPLEGVQFHPESILTTEGLKMMQNWVDSL